MQDADRELTAAIAGVEDDFAPGELAYLATTTKAEGPFRDRLAFRLHREYGPAGLVVAREWNRVDLAVLDDAGAPLALVELKAMYTFDALRNLSFFTDATSADEIKARRLARANTAVYSLLLATHHDDRIPNSHLKPVKYSGGINRGLSECGASAALLARACDNVDHNLVGRNVVARGEVKGGHAFGLGVSLHYWLVRNDGTEAVAKGKAEIAS